MSLSKYRHLLAAISPKLPPVPSHLAEQGYQVHFVTNFDAGKSALYQKALDTFDYKAHGLDDKVQLAVVEGYAYDVYGKPCANANSVWAYFKPDPSTALYNAALRDDTDSYKYPKDNRFINSLLDKKKLEKNIDDTPIYKIIPKIYDFEKIPNINIDEIRIKENRIKENRITETYINESGKLDDLLNKPLPNPDDKTLGQKVIPPELLAAAFSKLIRDNPRKNTLGVLKFRESQSIPPFTVPGGFTEEKIYNSLPTNPGRNPHFNFDLSAFHQHLYSVVYGPNNNPTSPTIGTQRPKI